jgi:hypothetical protein
MSDFSKAKIYKIVCNVTGFVYIGSTVQKISQRLRSHRFDYKKYLDGEYHYVTSFKILENANYEIILIEDYPCERKEELLARERHWIENTVCVNKHIPTRTFKEWSHDNKEKLDEYRKEYHINNKEKHNETSKEYRKNNREYMKERDKEYYLKNKEKIDKYQKEYHENNKEEINKQRKEYRENNKEKIQKQKREFYQKK